MVPAVKKNKVRKAVPRDLLSLPVTDCVAERRTVAAIVCGA